MYVVRNNFRHSATIFENTVFIIDVILFGTLTPFAFLAKEYLIAFEFIVFSLFGLIFLYQNNAVLAYVYDEEVIIRKFFKKYKYRLKQIESVTYNARQEKYELVFSDKKISIPNYYLKVHQFIGTLKMVNNYFATEDGVEELKYYIKEKASTETLLLSKTDIEPALFSSKIGGLPYWNLSLEYPVDMEGKKMHLLCQLNFGEYKFENNILPKEGILQFFISSNDDFYGASFNELHKKTGELFFMKRLMKIFV